MTSTTTRMSFELKGFSRILKNYGQPGKFQFTFFNHKIYTVIFIDRYYSRSKNDKSSNIL